MSSYRRASLYNCYSHLNVYVLSKGILSIMFLLHFETTVMENLLYLFFYIPDEGYFILTLTT